MDRERAMLAGSLARAAQTPAIADDVIETLLAAA